MFLVNIFIFRFGPSPLKSFFGGFVESYAIFTPPRWFFEAEPGLSIPCMFGARVLINILSLVRQDVDVSDAHPAYSTAKFAHPSTERGTGEVGANPLETDIGMSTSGVGATDSGLGTETQFSATTRSCGKSFSQGTMSLCPSDIEEVIRAKDDDIEMGSMMRNVQRLDN